MNDVLIVLFADSGLDRSALGVAGAGRRLSTQTGGELKAIVLGAAAGGFVEALGALVDAVILAEDEKLAFYQPDTALQALEQICSANPAAAILLGSDIYSQEITPRLAHRLGGSSLADAVEVAAVDGSIRATRSAYGGKAISVYELKRRPAVIWVRSRAMEPAEPTGSQAVVSSAKVSLETPTMEIVERRAEEQEGVLLEDAQLIVSGGRGLGGPEPFDLLKSLAATMGAEMGASRAACDSGWVPPTWQVGQTGKKVAPELYLAIAISGASQHLLGMSDSKTIAAINTDPDAPIFRHCSFGIVEDFKNVVPLLTEKLAELKK